MSDPYLAYVTLLMHCEGENNGTTFTDNSSVPKTITPYNGAITSTTQKKAGSTSADCTGDNYLEVTDTASLRFGTNPFTVEMFVYMSALSNWGAIFQKGIWNASGALTLILGSSSIKCCLNGNDTGDVSHGMSINTWTHVAITRDSSNNFRIFVNGVLKKTSTLSVNLNSTANIQIFNGGGIVSAGSGYVDEIRITTYCRYTENFTPPTVPFEDYYEIPESFTGAVATPLIVGNQQIDLEDNGTYRITGTVTELGLVGSYRVRLFDRLSGRLVRETWSDANGSYAFNSIAYRANGYFAIAYDHGAAPFNAAIADLITPELMP